ncbi:hypothetical protein Hanom_Chr11g01020981 [Helianthus anomalus]
MSCFKRTYFMASFLYIALCISKGNRTLKHINFFVMLQFARDILWIGHFDQHLCSSHGIQYSHGNKLLKSQSQKAFVFGR